MFQSGKHYFEGLKLKVPYFWNLDHLEKLLHDYHDKTIVQLLKFGCPVSHNGCKYNTSKIKNWQGGNVDKSAVKAYLQNELKYKSVVGPFKINPFDQPIGISPLNARDKKDSTEKRIILDLSFPVGLAINKGIDKD